MALAGLGVGVVVGLTGMGGGALMTPLLVLVFGVPPVAAVSSDLAASAIMKPFGGWVHARRGTVDWRLVGWLCAGSVPSAFAGVLLLRLLGDDAEVQHTIKIALGAALLLAAGGMLLKAWVGRRRDDDAPAGPIRVRPLPPPAACCASSGSPSGSPSSSAARSASASCGRPASWRASSPRRRASSWCGWSGACTRCSAPCA